MIRAGQGRDGLVIGATTQRDWRMTRWTAPVAPGRRVGDTASDNAIVITALLRAVYPVGAVRELPATDAADANAVRSPWRSIALIVGAHELYPYGTADDDDLHGTACGSFSAFQV